jgi:tetratricopeptide (TPR) repeat protein
MMEQKNDQIIQDLISARKFDEAESAIRTRLQNAPASADAHYLLGVMNYFKGNLRDTVQNLREALKHEPRHTDAAICLSVLLNDIGRYDDAKNVFEVANQSVSSKNQSKAMNLATGGDFEVDRKFSVKHLEIADLYFRYRRYEEAIEEYEKAASLDPFTFEIRIRLAKAYAKKGFVTRAIQELQQLKSENPRYAPARLQLGLLHFSQKNVLDAELEWESVLDLEAGNSEALAYLEMAKQSRGG